MKTASIHELKQELTTISPARVQELCLRLAKFKKENKELLTYLLFEAQDAQGYTGSVKAEMDGLFTEVNTSNVYFAKKTIRKILRIANKHIRYMGSPQAEVELLIHFCLQLKETGLPLHKSTVLNNLFQNQLKKIHKTLDTLHEDLQYDYLKDMRKLEG
ncbi:MAG TPA: hypothetical protein VLD19_04965 [Chitinophagaceae bacterium]|nr:hypothetical protein [Chitinophagaceae bacterium]